MVHDAFLIEVPIPEMEDYIQQAKQCMIDAAGYVVGGEIKVDVEKHFTNFKQSAAKDQKIFDTIFEEIEKYKNKKHGRVRSQKVV